MDEQKNPNLIREEDIPENWQEIDVKPIVPSETPAAVSSIPSVLPPYFRGSIPATLQHDAYLVGTDKNPRLTSIPLMPIAPSGNPQNNAAIQSGIIENTKTTTTVSGSMRFRGTWNSFTVYSIGDVVIDNISSYVAITASVNLEPDQGNSANWTLIGKNLNFRGIWSAFNPVRQSSHQVAANGNPTNASFASNVVSGNKVFVVVTVQNIGGTAIPVVGDSQGNVYANVYTSARVDSNQYCAFGYFATIATSGPLTVNVSYTNGGPPGFACAIIAELTNIAGVDQVGTASGNTTSGPFPAISVLSTNAGEVIVAGAFADGVFSAPTGYSSVGPFQSTIFAETFPSISGGNAVQFNGNFTNSGTRFVGGATTLFLQSGFAAYNPYDVVEFNGSMYLCVVSTNGSPISAPASWVLFAQSTGLAQVKTADYAAIVTDEGSLLSWNSSSAHTLTLPNPVPDSGFWISVMNIGTGVLTISPNGLLIDAAAGSLTLGQNQGMVIFSDGTNYFTIHGINSLSMPNIFIVSNPDGSGLVTITLANETANTVWAGPTSGGAAPPSFRMLVNADLPVTVPTVPSEFTVSGNVASPAGSLAISKANESANTVWAGPVSGGPAQPIFRALVAADIPPTPLPPLSIAQAIGTLITHSVSGNLRLAGNVIPPAGVYRVSVYFDVAANPSVGTLDVAIGWNDTVLTRSATNGTLGAPADISTAAFNVANGTIVLVSDGIHDITWAMTLT
jgi:hypothetical protein